MEANKMSTCMKVNRGQKFNLDNSIEVICKNFKYQQKFLKIMSPKMCA